MSSRFSSRVLRGRVFMPLFALALGGCSGNDDDYNRGVTCGKERDQGWRIQFLKTGG